MEKTKQEAIHEKGFDMYTKIKVGPKNLEDATLEIGTLSKLQNAFKKKVNVLKALESGDLKTIRELSRFYFNISGIYERVCKYAAKLYRYDWYIEPRIYNKTEAIVKKATKEFYSTLEYFDNSYIKKITEDIAEEVVVSGAYYGYWIDCGDSFVIQQLPIEYCRSRFNAGNVPAVEFDMSYFDTFVDIAYRNKILKLFPDEFAKGYKLYKEKKIPPETKLEEFGRYYLLDPDYAVKFSLSKNDVPMFVNAIPSIIDLDQAQELDRKKQLQSLSKILV